MLLVLQSMPASSQARLGGGQIRDKAHELLSHLESKVNPDTFGALQAASLRIDAQTYILQWVVQS
jgi:hypothetical protein